MADHSENKEQLTFNAPIQPDKPPTRGLSIMMTVLFLIVTASTIGIWQIFLSYSETLQANGQGVDSRLAGLQASTESDLGGYGVGGCPAADFVVLHQFDKAQQPVLDEQGMPRVRIKNNKPLVVCTRALNAPTACSPEQQVRVLQTMEKPFKSELLCLREKTNYTHFRVPVSKTISQVANDWASTSGAPDQSGLMPIR